MIAKEGFDAYGIDISEKSLELGKMMLEKWGVNANLLAEDMTSLSFESAFFDVIVDVFSSNCLDMENFNRYLKEVRRVLKKGGKFFLYTPSNESDAFINHHPAVKIDENTLNGIMRKDSPFYGNFYPFRFESIENLVKLLNENGFECTSHETISRTYRNGEESFQHISLEAIKIAD
jgi:ubiquinone/menaquinone biosynthesis C-methylase UbiE